jgi:hypothetical protein
MSHADPWLVSGLITSPCTCTPHTRLSPKARVYVGRLPLAARQGTGYCEQHTGV